MRETVLDPRDLESLRRQVEALARAYTPEWRFEWSPEDPGAALAELFCRMFGQTIDRFNSIPEKFFVEFLRMIGYQIPGPSCASGTVRFTVHNTVEEPIPVPAGTQLFTPDSDGQNIVYETDRLIEATSAVLEDVYLVDGQRDSIRRLDLSVPQRFFSPEEGEELQRHRFFFGENDVLRLDCPARIEVELRQSARYMEEDTARRLTEEGMVWSYCHGGRRLPFDEARPAQGRIFLEKRNSLALEADESGCICVACQGRAEQALDVEEILVRAEPLDRFPVQSMAFGDLPIPLAEGGYCFGRRPAAYGMFYLRSDTAFSKRGALVNLRLDISEIVDEPPTAGPDYDFRQPIIDKQNAVAVKPDDVYVSEVIWEYFNGLGWRRLEVTGDRNPFSCKRAGPLETVFRVPEDMRETMVNAEQGLYIRARVVRVENEYAMHQRWVVPFVRDAALLWQYDRPRPVRLAGADNNGDRVLAEDAIGKLRALETMEPAPQAMYLRFDRSPHAMPLSLRFEMAGHRPAEDQLLWECWTGQEFQPVRWLDLTGNLHHTGHMLLYLPQPLPAARLLGAEGCWLRLRRSAFLPGPSPKVAAIRCNTVPARQQQREDDVFFDTGVYEANKAVQLLSAPVQQCRVWVDEAVGLSLAQARTLAERQPLRTRLEWEDSVLRRCWVLWDRVEDLGLAGPEDRVYELDPYTGTVRFGDGQRGMVPPQGDHNIRISYSSGGGERGNAAPGRVNALVGALPRISGVGNITAMSGGTGRFSPQRVEELGSRRLRHRGRAVGRRDFEELVAGTFPQVRHVRCFTGLDRRERRASGHVTVVLDGFAGEGMEDLCRQVYGYLEPRVNCCLVREGRLHVCPAVRTVINTRVTIAVEQLDQAADTQQEIARRLRELVEDTWGSRPIGDQIRLDEIWRTVRDTPNVGLIHQLQVEGAFDQEGQPRLVPIESETRLAYAVVESGVHLVQIR